MQDIKTKALNLLYKWVSENKIPQIKKGMVEELETFVAEAMATEELTKSADRMQRLSDGAANEENRTG